MHYKTVMRELLEARPILRDRLERYRLILPTLDYYAAELRTTHQRWIRMLTPGRPDSERAQLSSEALELAIEELRERLPSYSQVSAETFCADEWQALLSTRSSAD